MDTNNVFVYAQYIFYLCSKTGLMKLIECTTKMMIILHRKTDNSVEHVHRMSAEWKPSEYIPSNFV